ncbi:MAG: pyridoxal-phosphate dependent enzyme [Oceanospirillales bacterium]|nr:pyridoxal-phosphate dependent enzyme [Oceanospirillales bacterium]
MIPDGPQLVMPIKSRFYEANDIQVAMLRLDLLHPQISGNKWFKLLRLIQRLEAGERPRVLSFGGVWSNHLHALAYVGKRYGIETLALVRGHASQAPTAMLEDARRWGMSLVYIDRDRYRDRNQPEFRQTLGNAYPGWEVLPEGGSSADAVRGCRTLWQLLEGTGWSKPDFFACAMGTGGTVAGVIAGKPEQTQVIGVPVLNLGGEAEAMVGELLRQAEVVDPKGWLLDPDGAWGGYARLPDELSATLRSFEFLSGVPLDPVYTVKLVAAVNRRIARGHIVSGSRVLLMHSGGLQGRRGMLSRIENGSTAFVGPVLV